MNSIVLIPTTFVSPILDKCINSVLSSDYSGDIVVASCYKEAESVISISDRVRFSYHPYNVGLDPSHAIIENAIMALDKEYDYIVLLHNDAILPKTWYSKMCEAWSRMGDKAWCVTIPSITHNKEHIKSYYTDYVYNNSYEDIIKTFKSIEVTVPVCANTPEQLFGLGIDVWMSGNTGRLSACSSIPYKLYKDCIVKYGGENFIVSELFILRDAIRDKRWAVWINTDPVMHFQGGSSLAPVNTIGNAHAYCYKKFYDYYGYDLEHLFTIWCGMVTIKHRVEITQAINEGRLGDIDYIFDEAEELLANRDCSKCWGLGVCRCKGNINRIGWDQRTLTTAELNYIEKLKSTIWCNHNKE